MIQEIKNNKKIVSIIILLLLIIILITSKIITKQELWIDHLAYNLLVTKLRTPNLTKFMKAITKLSNTNVIIILSIILTLLFLLKKQPKIAGLIPSNLICITLMNVILKHIFQRPRPTGYRLIEMTGYSFPSGHAMISMAFYGLIIYLINNLVKNKNIKHFLIIVNIIIIILIGISRVYLGVHYLSDVITGYSISIIYLLILTKILKKNKFFP